MNNYLTLLGFLAIVLFRILIPLAVTLVDHAGRKKRHLTAAMHYRRTVRRQRVVAWRPASKRVNEGAAVAAPPTGPHR